MTLPGTERAVALAVSGKLWSTCAGLLTTLLVASFFAADIQGYYYTFLSILALQVLAELGLGVVITAYSSHEWARLAFDRKGGIRGDADAFSRLCGLGRFALRWYLAAGVIVMLALGLGGLLFFGSTGWSQVSVWGGPWAALCIVTGINVCLLPFWAILEGCNQVANVYAYRLVQAIAVSAVTWLGIWAGAGLWVAPLIGAAAALASVATIGWHYAGFFRTVMFGRPTGPRLAWRADILPMQWRVAVSWLAGYLAFSLFTPVLFHYQGPVVAGRMGMTWAFIGALTGIATSWIAPKAPSFGILIAQGRFAELDRMFWRLTTVVVGVTAAGALAIWTLIYGLGRWGHPLAERLLAPADAACFLVATVLVAASLPMSTYLRAHKKEPLLVLSVVSGIVTGLTVVLAGQHYSARGVAIGYLAATAVITPFVALIWHLKRSEWHPRRAPA